MEKKETAVMGHCPHRHVSILPHTLFCPVMYCESITYRFQKEGGWTLMPMNIDLLGFTETYLGRKAALDPFQSSETLTPL